MSGNWTWRVVALLTLLGLALRLAAAQGGLWLDEAWSAVLAHEAGTPLGVFLNINHDNNHHLNSLWLQFVGLAAPSPLARALSIVTSTASIVVAAMIGIRSGRITAVVAAALFALSPMFVTLGSEARGYAPMALALLVAILLVDRWLAGELERRPGTALGLCFFLGALSQLTMIFGFIAVAGWAFLVLWKRSGFHAALVESLKLFGASLFALTLVVAIVAGAAAASAKGFQFGRYDPFDWLQYLHALVDMIGFTIGFPLVSIWLLVFAPVLVVLARGSGVARLSFYWLAIIAFPLMLALLQAGNVGYPRYYLLVSIALLLLVAEMIGLELAARGWKRWAAGAALVAMLVGSMVQNVALIENQRGDPAGAIAAMQVRAPQGARVTLERDTGQALLQTAAAQAHYPLEIVRGECPAERFLFVDRFKGETLPPAMTRCGRIYRPIAGARATGLSGTHWALYELVR